ncbi:MAG: hypothetical protein PHU61_01835 [Candidatus Absconditabacteria bacterium]|nr:hypothetical protein [Candidatus Absconditabacteria bacterium]MDD3868450.1 hypothetical protein [Candidatus Absconditabacteria bacterium]MDD4713976.1 hypothetical protein [Candidatus Absconditabacteria bacterium]
MLSFIICGVVAFVFSVNYSFAQETLTNGGTVETDSSNCLLGIGCTMSVTDILGVKQNVAEEERTSVLTLVQDFILAATMFIGTVVTLAFVYAGIRFIISAAKGDSGAQGAAKKGMLNAGIGMLLVMGAYVIIRAIQFLAAAG